MEEDSPSVRMLHPLLVALKRFKNVDENSPPKESKGVTDFTSL